MEELKRIAEATANIAVVAKVQEYVERNMIKKRFVKLLILWVGRRIKELEKEMAEVDAFMETLGSEPENTPGGELLAFSGGAGIVEVLKYLLEQDIVREKAMSQAISELASEANFLSRGREVLSVSLPLEVAIPRVGMDE